MKAQQTARAPLGVILAEARPHRRWAQWGLGAIIVGQLLATSGPFLIGLVIDRGISRGDPAWLLGPVLAYVLVSGGAIGAMYVESLSLATFAQRYLASLRGRLVDHLAARKDPAAMGPGLDGVLVRLTGTDLGGGSPMGAFAEVFGGLVSELEARWPA